MKVLVGCHCKEPQRGSHDYLQFTASTALLKDGLELSYIDTSKCQNKNSNQYDD